MTISCEFACTDEWKAFFKAYSRRRFFNVSFYDTELEDYVTKKMRLRNFKSDTEIYSDVETESVGLYNVTFNLIQF